MNGPMPLNSKTEQILQVLTEAVEFDNVAFKPLAVDALRAQFPRAALAFVHTDASLVFETPTHGPVMRLMELS